MVWSGLYRARQFFYFELNKYRLNKTIQNQSKLAEARKNFKMTIRRKRFVYDKSKTEKLILSRHKNVKEYWRMLKKAANIDNKNAISSKRFSGYFQAINNPSDTFYQADEDILLFKGEFQVMFDELNTEISRNEIEMAENN